MSQAWFFSRSEPSIWPSPMRDDWINETSDERRISKIRSKLSSFGNSTRHNSCSGCSKNKLEKPWCHVGVGNIDGEKIFWTDKLNIFISLSEPRKQTPNQKAITNLIDAIWIVVKYTISKCITYCPVYDCTTKAIQRIFDQNVDNVLYKWLSFNKVIRGRLRSKTY